MLLLEKEKG